MKEQIARSSAARRLIALAMAGTLALGAAATAVGALTAPEQAYAADGSVTITQKANEDATYDAYCLFTADIDDSNVATHVAWASGIDASEVVSWLDSANAYTAWLQGEGQTVNDDTKQNAQNALKYISTQISKSTGTSNPTWVNADTFASDFAKWVKNDSGIEKAGTATQGQAFTAPEGYYLFLSTGSTVGTSDMATAPIWFPLGGGSTTIDEKAAAPTIDKKVKEDSTGEWQDYADAEIGQSVEYEIDVTVPSNYGTFKTYYMGITDILSEGLQLTGNNESSVKVAVGNTDVTSSFNIDYDKANRTLTVACDNTKGIASISAGSTVTVTYTAELTGGAIVWGGDGNPNAATLTYSNDPNWSGQGEPPTSETEEVDANLYSYVVNVDKFDKTTQTALSGAQFVIKNAEDKYLTNGKWTAETQDDAQVFTTSADGSITGIKGLDAGEYTLIEIAAPDEYELPANPAITITVKPTYDASGKLSTLEADVVNAGNIAEFDSDASNGNTGTVVVDVANSKSVGLAMTGGIGVGIGGAVLLAIGLAWYLVRSRRRRASQAE